MLIIYFYYSSLLLKQVCGLDILVWTFPIASKYSVFLTELHGQENGSVKLNLIIVI